MTKYDWLLFDLDNTILDFSESSRLAFAKVYSHLNTAKELKDVYTLYKGINHSIWQEREAGRISHTELKTKRWKLLCDELNCIADAENLNNLYFEEIKVNATFVEGAHELLDHLQGKYKMIIITNGLSEVQWSRIEDKNLKQYFDHIVISDEIGVAKPATEFFDHCAQLIGHPSKDKVLVIGDTPMSDIKGGNNYGYDTCWYNHNNIEDDGQVATYNISHMKDLIPIL